MVISHLHGDHFGGLPVLLLERAARQERRRLVIAGPDGTAEAVQTALDVFRWPRAWTYAQQSQSVEFVVLRNREATQVAGLHITAFDVPHYPATAPSALRIVAEGKIVSYSGDSGWSEALIEAADGADLFICSILAFDDPDPAFLDYRTFREQRHRFSARHIVLTHLGASVLEHRSEIDTPLAEDGFSLVL